MSPVPDSGRLAFAARRNGAPIGGHVLTFTRKDDRLVVAIAVDYQVKIGPLTVFRYRLRGEEVWREGQLVSAHARTDANGKAEFMRATPEGDALVVEGSRSGRYRAPAGALVASHWNRAQLDAPMINPQDGSLLRFEVTPRGATRITDAAGRSWPAQGFTLAGQNGFDLWYDEAGVWAALQARVADGSTISYFRTG